LTHVLDHCTALSGYNDFYVRPGVVVPGGSVGRGEKKAYDFGPQHKLGAYPLGERQRGTTPLFFSSFNRLIKNRWLRLIVTVSGKQYKLYIVSNNCYSTLQTIPNEQCFTTEALFIPQ
jgi:hypothetical protein